MTLADSDAQTLTAALRRMGLIEADETPALEPLTGGVSSLIVRAGTRAGTLCVKTALARLKVAAEWLAPVERNSAEVAWLREAAGIVPDTVPRVLGEDRPSRAFAMAYLDPQRYPVWKSHLLAGRVEPAVATALATALAAIHARTARRPDLAAAFANDASFSALRLDPYLGAAARAHPDRAAALQALIDTTAGTRIALVHGDISPKNILCGPSGPVFLDAECAWYGDPAFDLAFCLNHLLLKGIWRPQWRDRYRVAYDRLARCYLEGVDWEPVDAFERRCARLLPGLSLARVDGKSPVEYLNDETQRGPVRRIARNLLARPVERLAAVADHWSEAA